MAVTTHEIRAVAATVWDQDTHSEAELAFLQALADADKECSQTLARSNVQWGATSEAHQHVKNLAYRQRYAAYVRAFHALEMAEEADIMGYAEAAE